MIWSDRLVDEDHVETRLRDLMETPADETALTTILRYIKRFLGLKRSGT